MTCVLYISSRSANVFFFFFEYAIFLADMGAEKNTGK